MSRPTPFDLVFADLAAARFPEIREEEHAAPSRGGGPGAFAQVASVQRLLAELADDAERATPEAVSQYLTALYAAYRFWDAGCRVVRVSRGDLELALAASRPVPPAFPKACYLQFPEGWFWAPVDEGAPHEPLDGIFVVAGDREDAVTLMAVLGLRPGRDGFSQIVAVASRDEFAAASAMVRHPPFGPTLEGGAAAGLRSIASQADLLHLAQLALSQANR